MKFLVLVLVLMMSSPQSWALVGRIDVTREGEDTIVSLQFDGPVTGRVLNEKQELLVQFDRPLGVAEDVEALLERLPDLLQGVRYGYDALLLELREGVLADVSFSGNDAAIRLTPASNDNQSVEKDAQLLIADDLSSYRLRRLRALLRGEQGDVLGSRADLDALRLERPQDVQTLIALAEADTRLTRWRQAITRYDRALRLNPDSQGVIAAKAELHAAYGSRLRLDQELQDVQHGDKQHISRLHGRAVGAAGIAMELDLERRYLRIPDLTRHDGRQGRFRGSRLRGKLTLVLDTLGAYTMAVGLSGGQSALGVHAGVSLSSNYGITALRARWREPYWELLEGIVDQGRVSGVHIEHLGEIDRQIRYELAVGYNRYDTARVNNAATSLDGKLGVSYMINERAPLMSLAYQLDTEHVLTRTSPRISTDGERFQPLPLTSREAHSVSVFMAGDLTDYLEAEGSVGYTIDRFNGDGPTAEASLRYSPLAELEFGVNGGIGGTFARGGDQRVLRFGAHLLLRGD